MKELTTKDVELWMRKMQTIRGKSDSFPDSSDSITPNQNALLGLRAAVALGWFDGEITQESIDNAPPGEAVAAGNRVWEIYTEAMTVDPNSSSPLASI